MAPTNTTAWGRADQSLVTSCPGSDHKLEVADPFLTDSNHVVTPISMGAGILSGTLANTSSSA